VTTKVPRKGLKGLGKRKTKPEKSEDEKKNRRKQRLQRELIALEQRPLRDLTTK
jgi:hypothetical protein